MIKDFIQKKWKKNGWKTIHKGGIMSKIDEIKDYVEERMQQIDELGNHFMKMEMYDDVRKADIEGRGNELVKVYEMLSN